MTMFFPPPLFFHAQSLFFDNRDRMSKQHPVSSLPSCTDPNTPSPPMGKSSSMTFLGFSPVTCPCETLKLAHLFSYLHFFLFSFESCFSFFSLFHWYWKRPDIPALLAMRRSFPAFVFSWVFCCSPFQDDLAFSRYFTFRVCDVVLEDLLDSDIAGGHFFLTWGLPFLSFSL